MRIYKNGALYVFLLYTGCRVGEALALRWSDIDFETRTAKIYKTVARINDRSKSKNKTIEIVSNSTKTGVARTIYLSDMAIAALRDLQEQIDGSQTDTLSM